MKITNFVRKEGKSLIDNIKETSEESVYGPVGLVSNPLRFFFYSSLLGASQLLILQVISGAINRAMDKKN